MARDDSMARMMEVYQQPLFRGLTENSQLALQPPEIKVALKPHQLAMVHELGQTEQSCLTGFTVNQEIHYSQFAILGDKVGSGKTLMMLAHIAEMKRNPVLRPYHRIHQSSKSAFWSQKPINNMDFSGNTLIIVPHTLYHQWKHAIQQQTTLSFFEVKTTRALEKPDFLELIKTRDITLMSNTIIKHLTSDPGNPVRSQILWSRIIFDEVDNVQFTSTTQMPKANFYWLMTATWPNLLFQGLYMYMTEAYLNRGAQQGLHPDLVSMIHQDQIVNGNSYYARYDVKSHNFFGPFISTHPNRGTLVLRTCDAFMEQSWRSPPVNEQRIICESPAAHRIVANFVSPEIQELLHAGDVQGALEKLGVSNTSQSSLIEAVCDTREKELDRLQRTLAFKETLDYATPQAKEQAINALKAKITSLKDQVESLKQRILHVKNEICAICFDEPKTPTFVMCCSRLFCGACIVNCIQRNPSCPMCRAALGYTSLRQVQADEALGGGGGGGRGTTAVDLTRKPKKKDALLKLITENQGGRFLVFNRYDNPFSEIEDELVARGIRVGTVRGNKDHISIVLKQFEKGEIQVLLMNSTQAGVGMDLKSATHILLMHTMRKEEEKQIIGRAIRLGRTEPLTLVRLLHENEGHI